MYRLPLSGSKYKLQGSQEQLVKAEKAKRVSAEA